MKSALGENHVPIHAYTHIHIVGDHLGPVGPVHLGPFILALGPGPFGSIYATYSIYKNDSICLIYPAVRFI